LGRTRDQAQGKQHDLARQEPPRLAINVAGPREPDHLRNVGCHSCQEALLVLIQKRPCGDRRD
jgi:hypothetical protein